MIDSFEGKYAFLNNDYPVVLHINGYTFQTVTAAYEALKSEEPKDWTRFQWLTAGQAQREGQKLHLRPDWDSFRVPALRELLSIKFKDSYLANWLCETKPHQLVHPMGGLGQALMSLRIQLQGDIPW